MYSQSSQLRMARRCQGTTRAGRPCSLTAASTVQGPSGKCAADPLRHGGCFCLYHAKPFCTTSATVPQGPLVVLFLDLETTGTDVAEDRIVELAATEAPSDARSIGQCFSTTVGVDETVLESRGSEAALVHGICNDELQVSPSFRDVWSRFTNFSESLLDAAWLQADSTTEASSWLDSEDEHEKLANGENEQRQSVIPYEVASEPPSLVMVAHNGFRFDFPILLFECARHEIPWGFLERCLFVDTLHVLRATGQEPDTRCLKLQCLVSKAARAPSGLNAHRALDDCLALRAVMELCSESYSIPVVDMMKLFAQRLDPISSAVQMAYMRQ